MRDDKHADVQTLADLLADPEVRQIWEDELWIAFEDPALRQRFEQETGLGVEHRNRDPLHGFTPEAQSENDNYAFAFIEWFSRRCLVAE